MIEVGSDNILGLGRNSLLSPPLLAHLHSKSLYCLHQFSISPSGGQLGEHWLNGTDLQLDSVLKDEWDDFTQQLTDADIRLQERLDALIWTGGDSTGFLTAKNVYQALATKFWT